MSKFIIAMAAVAMVASVSACAKQPEPEPVYVAPEPISVEPAYTGKYK
ncbi:hypothetical protein [Donghicola tyrosinivorans]|jgi:hypothetical protein|uniref:Lipoprotein n=1 Tax=Donghicola tyrosinivorans TaxID=1652492 RepID=A0A2T0X4T9_9RHOB|nr:hypothetical protein [Donghicola tyrosinivorans]PRY93935.1 hypothetical protein CLV74_10165 [Donghicola tyrosinivorans]